MVLRPLWSANTCWQPTGLFVLLASLAGAVPAAAEKSGGDLFGLSALFSTASTPAKTDRRTRVVIDLAQRTKFEIFSLNNPSRVIIDLPQVDMRLPNISRANSSGLVGGIRAGQAAPGRSRVVIDVTEPVVVEKSEVRATASGRGAELELVIVPFSSTSKATRAALKKRPAFSLGGPNFADPPAPRDADRSQSKRDGYKPLIVIDPGHGGMDSGARKFGVNEKDVVLAFGHTLRDRLLATGRYRVKMTRDTDLFITLERRREIAEENNAALFIAVHADYAGANANGATIYSLRERVARRLREDAAEDAARDALSERQMKFVAAKNADLDAVRGILGDLAQREVHANLERTNFFAQFAVTQMGAATTMRSRPHQEAAFKVLKTARVPSVLIELAYVSNRHDAARLQSQRWRSQVSASLVTAIEKYFDHSLAQIAQ